MKRILKIGQTFIIYKIIYDPLISNNRFPNFDPLTATGMALCVNLGPKCQNLFPLVSEKAESSFA
jgi:hypothetical protein